MPRLHSAATAPRPTSRTHATPNGRFWLRSSRSGGACLLAVASWGTFARAELPSRVQPLDTTSDGVYGRMEGDVTFSARAHAELAPGGLAPGGRLAAHYFWMAGIYTGFDRPLSTQATDHVWSFGVEARPAFIPRWATGRQLGPDFADLTLDSIAVSVGAYLADAPDATPDADRGLEVGVGFGLPLLARAQGPWLECRGFLRHPDGGGEAHFGVQLGLAWHVAWLSPLTRPRGGNR